MRYKQNMKNTKKMIPTHSELMVHSIIKWKKKKKKKKFSRFNNRNEQRAFSESLQYIHRGEIIANINSLNFFFVCYSGFITRFSNKIPKIIRYPNFHFLFSVFSKKKPSHNSNPQIFFCLKISRTNLPVPMFETVFKTHFPSTQRTFPEPKS